VYCVLCIEYTLQNKYYNIQSLNGWSTKMRFVVNDHFSIMVQIYCQFENNIKYLYFLPIDISNTPILLVWSETTHLNWLYLLYNVQNNGCKVFNDRELVFDVHQSKLIFQRVCKILYRYLFGYLLNNIMWCIDVNCLSSDSTFNWNDGHL